MIVHAIYSPGLRSAAGHAASATVADLAQVLIERDHTVHLHPLPPARRGLGLAARDLAEEISPRDEPGALLHALDARSWFVAAAANELFGLPLALRVADRDLAAAAALPRGLLAGCLRTADAVAATTTAARRAALALGVPPERVGLVPDLVRPLTGPVLDLPMQRRVLYLDGRPGPAAQARAAIARYCRVATDVPHDAGAVATAMDASDVIVCGPDQDLFAIQAMWRGRAVLATQSAAMEDVVIDRCTGRLVGGPAEVVRELRLLLASPFLVQAHGFAARRRAEARFDPARVAAPLEELYRAAAGRALRARPMPS